VITLSRFAPRSSSVLIGSPIPIKPSASIAALMNSARLSSVIFEKVDTSK